MAMVAAREQQALQDALGRGGSDLAGIASSLNAGGSLGSAPPIGTGAAASRQVLNNAQRVAALSDPRVQKALDAALNGPNALAAQQYKGRNTTRVSAERKF